MTSTNAHSPIALQGTRVPSPPDANRPGKAKRSRREDGSASKPLELACASDQSTQYKAKDEMTSTASVRRTARIDPDSRQVLWIAIILVGFLAVTSFAVSFAGLSATAAWAGILAGLAWAVPAFVDVSILAYTLAVLIHRQRGERTIYSWIPLGLFTAFSMLVNAAHVWAMAEVNQQRQIIGMAIAAAAPLAVFFATEQIARLAIEPPAGKTATATAVPAGSAAERQTAAANGRSAAAEEPAARRFGKGNPAATAEDSAGKTAAAAVPVAGVLARDSGVLPFFGSQNGRAANVLSLRNGSGKTANGSPAGSGNPAGNDTAAGTAIGNIPAAAATPGGSPSAVETANGRPIGSASAAAAANGNASRVPAAANTAADDDTALANYVTTCARSGAKPTGKGAAAVLGMSERTGRERLKELKARRPELFGGAR